jgi:hypothetical protein
MFGTFFSALLISLVAGAVFGWAAFAVTFVVFIVVAWIIEAGHPGTFT